jgi:hypothetical protein
MYFRSALAAAAVIIGTGAASAADLARKASTAAEYVKVCDAYGAGYFYIPGSDTCLRIGGFVRAEYRLFAQNSARVSLLPNYGWSRGQNGATTRVRLDLMFDARTNTEMGLLRSFTELWITQDTAKPQDVSLRKAFVQFGGLTAGRANSNFDFLTFGIGATDSYELLSTSFSEVNQLAYTFQFGNGISATLGIEDPTTSDEPGVAPNYGYRRLYGPYGGMKTPDLVGNVAISQGWGSAQIMGALRDDYGDATVNQSKLGYAFGAGIKVKLPMLGAGDEAALQMAWSKGALGYVAAGVWPGNTPFTDFEYTGGQFLQSTAWSVAGGINHNWSPQISTGLGASYLRYDAPAGSVNADFSQIDVQGSVRWKPANGVSFTTAVEYRHVDRSNLRDGDGLVSFFRVQRDF